MAADAAPEGGTAAEGPGMTTVRPPEEVISLELDEVPTQWPRGRGGRGSARLGRGRGRGHGKGRAEPAPRPQEMDEALQRHTRPGPDDAPRLPANTHPGMRRAIDAKLARRERLDRDAVFRLAKNEVLQTAEHGFLQAEGRERTTQFMQADMLDAVAVGVARKRFSFDLPYGPYKCAYTANGQHLLAGGRKGQVALLQCETMQVKTELQLKETIHDVQMLHNNTMFAVAQKKYAHIYDQNGLELHCLKDHRYTSHLEFLHYHYLLVTAGEMGDLRYRDISTGQEVCVHQTRLGPARSLRQNPRNAVMHMGHSNGTVTLWTPNVKEPVVKALCHGGHVTGLAVHGDYMVSSGSDGWWKVWDMRKWESVHGVRSYGHAVSDMDVSMTGLLAVGFGSHLEIWKDLFCQGQRRVCYIKEEYPGKMISSVRFRPYEDVCAVGHSDGFANLLVPGAGFANFDTFEANPFETKKQRREKEVRSLLEKLQPDSITLDPSAIGSIDKAVAEKYKAAAQKKKEEEKAKKKKRKKMRGKGKVGARVKTKNLEKGKVARKELKGRIQAEKLGDEEGPGEACDSSDSDAESDNADDDEASAPDGGSMPQESSAGMKLGALARFSRKRGRKT